MVGLKLTLCQSIKRATASGIICDTYGVWIAGFKKNARECSTIKAKLWGVYYGLYLAWDTG